MSDEATVTTDADVVDEAVTPASDADLPAGYVRNEDGSITAHLVYPVADGPREVVLKRLNGRAMVDVMNAKADGDRVKRMVLGSVGMVGPKGEAFFNALDAWDVVLLGEACAGFLPSGRTTGR
ncbi:hypothetical protein LWC05_11990 [Acetobacter sicerae]|uniref:Uncharacterized protein n=1 Tax=Acetobacter sicerae TaxID=85325 RepID=A0ABS8VX06_9PROT|nr:hypothetical protein [Acetobacter sicerae]MCE0744603.1 hypothetical protein [Acetobacter sicerae]